MAWTSNGTGAEFGAGVQHVTNQGRANVGSITLGTDARNADQGLAQTSDRWSALTPRGVLASATGGSPADTDAVVQWGQQAVGDRADTELAQSSVNRMMMTRAAGVGSSDGVD